MKYSANEIICIAFSFLFFRNVYVFAQTGTTWHGKKCAVVLTYDDGLNVHLTNVIPALDSVGLKGTFYVSNYFNGLQPQIANGEKPQPMDMNWEIIPSGIPVREADQEENL